MLPFLRASLADLSRAFGGSFGVPELAPDESPRPEDGPQVEALLVETDRALARAYLTLSTVLNALLLLATPFIFRPRYQLPSAAGFGFGCASGLVWLLWARRSRLDERVYALVAQLGWVLSRAIVLWMMVEFDSDTMGTVGLPVILSLMSACTLLFFPFGRRLVYAMPAAYWLLAVLSYGRHPSARHWLMADAAILAVALFQRLGTRRRGFTDACRQLARTRRVEAEHRRMQRELDDAAEIARALLPSADPCPSAYDVQTFLRPLSESSGDWHALELSPSERHLHLLLADITGHGVQGAIIASTCRTVLAMLKLDGPAVLDDPVFVTVYARALNQVLCEQGRGLHVVSFLGLTFAPAEERLHVTLAGHPAPLFLGPDGRLRAPELRAAGNPLGFGAGLSLETTAVAFVPGDQVVAFTDGLPLRPGIRRRERQLAALRPEALAGPQAFYEALCAGELLGGSPPDEDDVSVVWVKARADAGRLARSG